MLTRPGPSADTGQDPNLRRAVGQQRVMHRKLLAFEPAAGWNGGKVTVEVVGRVARAGRPELASGLWWSRWAGERVAGAGEHTAEAAE